jgi:DNA-binding CsgD family transcriptional regulator
MVTAMNSELLGETRKLRRNLAKLDHEHLRGFGYTKPKIFRTCETDDCGSYVCNLSTGVLEEIHGFIRLLSIKAPLNTVEDLDMFTHPEDRKKIHDILRALCELNRNKRIHGDDRLSITYRIRFRDRYIQVNRKSGLAIKKSTGEVMNWSNLYAMTNMVPLDNVQFRWTGRHITNKDLMALLVKKREKIFTRKELEILTLLLDEKSSSEMIELLCVSPETLKKHLSNMYKKSGTSNRRELARYIESSLRK